MHSGHSLGYSESGPFPNWECDILLIHYAIYLWVGLVRVIRAYGLVVTLMRGISGFERSILGDALSQLWSVGEILIRSIGALVVVKSAPLPD